MATNTTTADNDVEEGGENEDKEEETPKEIEIIDGETFIVDRILDEVIKEDGSLWYLVRWQDYGPEFDTSEPSTGLAHCVDILRVWEEEKAARQKQNGKQNLFQLFTFVQSGSDPGHQKAEKNPGVEVAVAERGQKVFDRMYHQNDVGRRR
jgi:Chromo (CHRromatin Organisation MOdifier) domain